MRIPNEPDPFIGLVDSWLELESPGQQMHGHQITDSELLDETMSHDNSMRPQHWAQQARKQALFGRSAWKLVKSWL